MYIHLSKLSSCHKFNQSNVFYFGLPASCMNHQRFAYQAIGGFKQNMTYENSPSKQNNALVPVRDAHAYTHICTPFEEHGHAAGVPNDASAMQWKKCSMRLVDICTLTDQVFDIF